MAWESQDDGFIAKILLQEGAKDIPVGTPAMIFVEEEVWRFHAVQAAFHQDTTENIRLKRFQQFFVYRRYRNVDLLHVLLACAALWASSTSFVMIGSLLFRVRKQAISPRLCERKCEGFGGKGGGGGKTGRRGALEGTVAQASFNLVLSFALPCLLLAHS